MRIGIDVRFQNETGVGRYIRNLLYWIPKVSTHELVELNPPIPWHSFREQIEMPRILAKQSIDIMHFPYFNVPLLYRKKFVVTIHDLIINEYDTGRASTHSLPIYYLKRMGYLASTSHAISHSQSIIVPSHATKDQIVNHYLSVDPDKIKVTYEGIDHTLTETTPRVPRSCASLKKDEFFLYVGNAYPHKNVEFLISALAKHTISTPLVMVGSMNYFYQRIYDLVKQLHREQFVILTGTVSDEELSWLYQNAQALVLPSLMEGFGLPALEAMQQNCPVVASTIPAFTEVCEDTAWYFDPTSAQSLVSILDDMKNTPHKERMEKLKKARERAEKFSWKKMAKETIEIYERSAGL